jgi:hypothetical protein
MFTGLVIAITACWITIACYLLQRLEPAKIRSVSAWLIPVVLFTYAGILYFLPKPTSPDIPWPIVRAVHYSGIGLLFAFLIFGAICQWRLWQLFKTPKPDSLAQVENIYRHWWAATRILPAPAAFCIVLSGLRLVYEDAGHGLLIFGWLFWLIAGFSFFFFDGLMFYLPEICCQFKAAEAALRKGMSLEEFCFRHRKPFHEGMLFFHSLSFLVVFYIGCAKPDLPVAGRFSNWLLVTAGNWTSGPDNPRVLAAGLLVLVIGFGWLLIRLPGLIAQIKFLFSREMK